MLVYEQNQIYFPENWTQNVGKVPLFYKNVCEKDVLGMYILTGFTINSSNDHEILIQNLILNGFALERDF